MTIEEIRAAFLGFYEKRLRLQLLKAELMALKESAKSAYVDDPVKIESEYSLVTFEMRIIETIVADTYPLTADHPGFLATIQQLRQQVIAANNRGRVFFPTASLGFTNKGSMIRGYNEFMAKACTRIVELSESAQTYLEPLLAA